MDLYIDKDEEFLSDILEDSDNLPFIPDGLWFKCDFCEKTLYNLEVKEDRVCPNCSNYFRMSWRERIDFLADENSFVQLFDDLKGKNYLNYPNYEEKIKELSETLETDEAVVTGTITINNIKTCVGVMDSRFIMGSMGSVVGEKITSLFEFATLNNLPVILFTASGGARMQEGIISLMQMAKVSFAVKKHSDKGLLYITYLTDPTMGGVSASFAMQGDIILAEPKALIGFAGKRVIEQTIKQQLPDDFQRAEMLLKTGFIDKIVERVDMRETLYKILKIHNIPQIELKNNSIDYVESEVL